MCTSNHGECNVKKKALQTSFATAALPVFTNIARTFHSTGEDQVNQGTTVKKDLQEMALVTSET